MAADDLSAVAFGEFDPSDCRVVQDGVAVAGFYNGAIAGAFGPRTRKAPFEPEAYLQYSSYDKVSLDLTTSEGDESEGG